MKRSNIIADDIGQVKTVDMLAQTFKGISSHHISRLKNQVLQSKDFFGDLWSMYVQLRQNPGERLQGQPVKYPDKTLFIIVTSEGALSGDIDRRLIDWMLKEYDPATHELIVLGHHGMMQLAQTRVKVKKYYKLPDQDVTQIDTGPIINDIVQYPDAKVFYQTYVTLTNLDIKSIDLFEVMQDLGGQAGKKEERITRQNYIFEPTFDEVISYMESIMMGVALSQVILESKLAQYASRFNAMSQAHERAGEVIKDLDRDYRRSKRAESDERTREVINGMRHGG